MNTKLLKEARLALREDVNVKSPYLVDVARSIKITDWIPPVGNSNNAAGIELSRLDQLLCSKMAGSNHLFIHCGEHELPFNEVIIFWTGDPEADSEVLLSLLSNYCKEEHP